MVTIIIPNLNAEVKFDVERLDTRKVTDFGNGAKIDYLIPYRGRDVLILLPKKGVKIKVLE